jgi:hypothetical protein
MQTLYDKCQQLYESSRGGWFSTPAYHPPVVPEPLAGELAEWYVIVMSDSLWVLRDRDVPRGDFPYHQVRNKVLVRIVRKTRHEYIEEEDRARFK